MKNYCGILEHDYECNCINAEIKGLSSDEFNRFISETSKVKDSFYLANETINALSKQLEYQTTQEKPKHPSNLTPKKKKRKR